MKFRFAVLAAALASCAGALSPAALAQTKWDLPTGYPLNNPHTVTLQLLAKDVERATAGKLMITVHPNGSLFKAPEIKRAVQSGQAQLGEVLMSLLENENAVYGVDSIPFLATGFDAAYKLWRAQRPVAEKVLARQGLKLVYAVAWPPQGIYAKKALASTADMKGLKWRAYNKGTSRIAELVGANPVTVQAADLAQSLATGVVDSMMTSGATGVDSKVWESLNRFYNVEAWLPKNMLIINQKAFDALGKDDQATVLRLAGEAEQKGWERMRAYTAESLEVLKRNKMIVESPNPKFKAELAKIGDTLLKEWLERAGDDGKAIVAAMKK